MEGENFKIVGRNLSKEQIEESGEHIKNKLEESLKPLENELEKTPDELKFIELMNSFLSVEFEELGIDRPSKILPEQIHLFDKDGFKKNFSDTKYSFHQHSTKAAYIDKEGKSRKRLGHTIVHEAIHILSSKKYFRDAKGNHGMTKSGYLHVQSPIREGDRSDINKRFKLSNLKHEHMRGFNEAVIDVMAIELLGKNSKNLIDEFKITNEEIKENLVGYVEFVEILNIVIDGVAERDGKSKEEVWKKFKKGVITGDMMHLREIEKTFGSGSLRVLAFMGTNDATKLSEDHATQKIKKYFETDSEDEREKIAEEIFGDRELKAYKKRRN